MNGRGLYAHVHLTGARARVSDTNDGIQKMDLNRRQRSGRQLVRSLSRAAETNSVRNNN